jgi:hypothetical protein
MRKERTSTTKDEDEEEALLKAPSSTKNHKKWDITTYYALSVGA